MEWSRRQEQQQFLRKEVYKSASALNSSSSTTVPLARPSKQNSRPGAVAESLAGLCAAKPRVADSRRRRSHRRRIVFVCCWCRERRRGDTLPKPRLMIRPLSSKLHVKVCTCTRSAFVSVVWNGQKQTGRNFSRRRGTTTTAKDCGQLTDRD